MPSVASDMTHMYKTEGKKELHHCEDFLLITFLLWFTTSTATWMQGVLHLFVEGGHTQVYVGPS